MFAASSVVLLFSLLFFSDDKIKIPSLIEERYTSLISSFIRWFNNLFFHMMFLYHCRRRTLSLSFYHSVFVGPLSDGALQSISKSNDARPLRRRCRRRRRRRLLYLLFIVLSALAFESVPSLQRNRQLFYGNMVQKLAVRPVKWWSLALSRSGTVATVFFVVTMCHRVWKRLRCVTPR